MLNGAEAVRTDRLTIVEYTHVYRSKSGRERLIVGSVVDVMLELCERPLDNFLFLITSYNICPAMFVERKGKERNFI